MLQRRRNPSYLWAMATKTSPLARSRRARPHPVGFRAAGRPHRSGRRQEAAAKKKPQRASTRQILSPCARDALGIGLVVFAGLAVLSVWFDAAGPWARRSRAAAQRRSAGSRWRSRWSGSCWGVVLLRDVAPEDRVRMFIGFVVLALGVLGLLSLARGNPGVFAPLEDTSVRAGLGDAGGFIGALAAYPLSKVVSPIGAVVIVAGPRRARPADLHRHARSPRLERKVVGLPLEPGREGRGREDGRGGEGRREAEKAARPEAAPAEAAAKPKEPTKRAKLMRGHRAWSKSPSSSLPESSTGVGRSTSRPTAEEPGAIPAKNAPEPARSPPPRARTSCRRSTCCARRRPPRTTASHETGHDGGARAHAHDVRRRRAGRGLLTADRRSRCTRSRSPPAPRSTRC